MARPYALLTFLAAVAILWFSTAPFDSAGWTFFPHEDKVMHFLEYFVLAFLACKAFSHSSDIALAGRAALAAFLLAVSYGALLELVQAFIPYRSCSLLDFAANCAGAALAVRSGGGRG